MRACSLGGLCLALVGMAASAFGDVTYTFNADGQGFVSEFISSPFSGPWTYKPAIGAGGTGGWATDGQAAEINVACTADLVSPVFTVGLAGTVRLSFEHRHSLEDEVNRWDGGAVFISVNGGPATKVPSSAFLLNGYDSTLIGNSKSVLAGQPAFTAKSNGYNSGAFITSVADLGRFNPGDTVQVRFRFAGDTNTTGGIPTWAVDNINLREGLSSSAFTYQGVLRESGAPVAGPVNMRFTLYNSSTESGPANLIAGPVLANGVVVGPGGVVTVPIDFGPNAFDERAAWIGVEVLKEGTFVPLMPRTAMVPAPNAAYASKAGTALSVQWGNITGKPAALPPWNAVSGGISYTDGLVGLGSPNPSSRLTVRAVGTAAQSFERSDGAQKWNINMNAFGPTEPGLSFSENGINPANFVLREGGRVGINTSPAYPLHVVANGETWPQMQVESNAAVGTWFNLRNSSTGGTHWRMISTGSSNGEGAGKLLVGFGNSAGANSSVMTLQQNGAVGLGVDNPFLHLETVAGGIIGNSTTIGVQHDTTNRGLKISFGYQVNGSNEFVGMRSLVGPGTAGCGNTGDIRFDTWECQSSISREVMRITGRGNVGIGTSSPSQRLTVNGNVLANNVAVPSSIRFKDHVSVMDDALASLLKLEGVRFDWKPEWAKQRPGREHDIGFVAEDVAKVFPEVVFYDEDGNVTGMDYSRLTAVAVQAIKQLKVDQQQEVRLLREENAELRARLERLEAKIK